MGRSQPGSRRMRRRLFLESLEARRPLASTLHISAWDDADQNGVRAPEELALPGIVAELFRSTDDQIGNEDDQVVATSVTDEAGSIVESNLSDGNYFYRLRTPVGYSLTLQDVGSDDDVDSDVSPLTSYSSLLSLSGNESVEQGVGASGAFPKFGTALSLGSTNSVLGNGFVDVGKALALDPDGNMLVAGSFVGAVDFDNGPASYTYSSQGAADAFLAKLTPGGALLWSRSIGSAGNDQIRDLSVDSAGNVYAAGVASGDVVVDGQTFTALGSTDAFVTKIDADGNLQWHRFVGGSSPDLASSLWLDEGTDTLLVGGKFRGDADFDPGVAQVLKSSAGSNDAFLLALNMAGDHRWVQTLGGTGSSDEVVDVVADATGSVYALGRFSNSVDFDPSSGQRVIASAGLADMFLWKSDLNGTFVDVGTASGTNNLFPRGLDSHPDGGVVAAGSFRGNADFDPGSGVTQLNSLGQADIFVARYDANLGLQWARSMGGIGSDQANTVSVNGSGVVVTSGYIGGTADLDPGTGEYIVTPDNEPGFVSRLTPAGDFLAAETWALIAEQALTQQGQLMMTGSFAGTAEIVPGFGLTSQGGSDIFLSRLATNQAPIAFPQTANALEDIELPITLDGDDGDPTAHQQLTFTITSLPATGRLATTPGGAALTSSQLPIHLTSPQVYFKTALNDVEQQRFGFRVRDDGGTTNGGVNTSPVATVTVDITPVNDQPTANNATVTALDQVPLEVRLTGEDGDADTIQQLTYTVVSLPAVGKLSTELDVPPLVAADLPLTLSGDRLFFLNEAENLETQFFDFRVMDDGGVENGGIDTSFSARITVDVLSNENPPLNNQPTAHSQTVSAIEDQFKSISLTGEDGDSDRYQELRFQIVGLPGRGTLHINETAAPIQINDLPLTLPSNQVVFLSGVDDANDESFQFRVVDDGGTLGGGQDTSDSATVTVDVTPVNDAPEIVTRELTAYEDRTTELLVVGDDGDPEAEQLLVYTILQLPQEGTVSRTVAGPPLTPADLPTVLVADKFYFTPVAGNFDSQELTIGVRDDGGTANGGVDVGPSQQVTIVVATVNDQPTADGQQVGALEDVPTPISLSGDDGDSESNQQLSFWITELPEAGTLRSDADAPAILSSQLPFVLPANQLLFTTAADDVADRSFEFVVKDDGGTANGGVDTSESATVSIDVTPVNDAPTIEVTSFQTSEDVVLAIPFTVGDGDPEVEQEVTVVLQSLPLNAELSLSAEGVPIQASSLPLSLIEPTVYLTPQSNTSGPTTFDVLIRDDGGTAFGGIDETSAQVQVDVIAVNDPPIAHSATVDVLEDQSLTFELMGEDGDDEVSQELTYVLQSLPNQGRLSASQSATPFVADDLPITLDTPQLFFAPLPDSVVDQFFEFLVRDDGGGTDTSETAVVSLDMTPVNDPPTIGATTFQTPEDVVLHIPFAVEDGDAEVEQSVSVVIQSLPQNGHLSLTQAGAPIAVSSLPLVLTEPSVYLTPQSDTSGQLTFDILVQDDGGTDFGGENETPAQILVDVLPVNDPPIADALTVELLEDQSVSLVLTGEDGDPELDQALTFVLQSLPQQGELRATPDGHRLMAGDLPIVLNSPELYFQPVANSVASQQFEFHVRDDGGGSDVSQRARVTLNVTPVNDQPMIGDLEFSVLEDQLTRLALSGDDGDPDADQTLSFLIMSLPAEGQLLGTPQGEPLVIDDLPFALPSNEVYFQPAPDESGLQQFQVVVRDDGGTENGGVDESSPATATITITAVNDAPTADSQTIQTREDTLVAITLTGQDSDEESEQELTFVLQTIPLRGSLLVQLGGDPIQASGLPLVLSNPQLFYEPALNDTDAHQFDFVVMDDGGTENGGVDTSSPATVQIAIQAVNDSPEIQGPASYDALTYQTLGLSGLSVDDPDSGDSPVTLLGSVSEGTLIWQVDSEDSPLFTVTGNDTLAISISGKLADLQNALADNALGYRSHNTFSGDDQLQLTIRDNGATGQGDSLEDTLAISIHVDASFPWHNFRNPVDINDDGQVTAIDALLIINRINVLGSAAPLPTDVGPPPFFDASSDNQVTPIDALLVINHLNLFGAGEGETELVENEAELSVGGFFGPPHPNPLPQRGRGNESGPNPLSQRGRGNESGPEPLIQQAKGNESGPNPLSQRGKGNEFDPEPLIQQANGNESGPNALSQERQEFDNYTNAADRVFERLGTGTPVPIETASENGASVNTGSAIDTVLTLEDFLSQIGAEEPLG